MVKNEHHESGKSNHNTTVFRREVSCVNRESDTVAAVGSTLKKGVGTFVFLTLSSLPRSPFLFAQKWSKTSAYSLALAILKYAALEHCARPPESIQVGARDARCDERGLAALLDSYAIS
jgi:hypothetical protein